MNPPPLRVQNRRSRWGSFIILSFRSPENVWGGYFHTKFEILTWVLHYVLSKILTWTIFWPKRPNLFRRFAPNRLVFIFFAGKAIGVQKNQDDSIKAFERVGITKENYYEIMELEAAFWEHLKQEKKYKKLHRVKIWERQFYGFDGRWKRLEKKIKKPT